MHCKYLPLSPYKPLEKFSKALYGTKGGTYSARIFRPVMHVLVCSFKLYLYTRHSRSSSAIKITSFSYQGKMKLSDERSRDCNSLEIEIKRFVDISLVSCNEHN